MIGGRWVFVGLLAVACKHDPWPGLVVTTALEAGDEDCPPGGTRIDAGADDGDPGGTAGDGELQDAEIDDSAFACTTTSEHAMLSVTTALPVGDGVCANGGTHVDFGTDDGDPGGTADDGILQAEEIEGSDDLCLDAPDEMISIVTELPFGDADCTFGGDRVESGLDDGDPAGTAGDGILQAEEIDQTDLVCATDPSDVFPTPAPSPPGMNRIDVSGGDGGGQPSAAQGGNIHLSVYGGPLPSAIFLQKGGALGTTAPAPTPAIDLGANALEITASTTLSYWDGSGSPPGTPHLRWTEEDTFEDQLGEIWVGGARMTGLHVHAGATLTIEADEVDGILLAADLHNEGTIVPSIETTTADDVIVWCDDFVNEGTIDTRAAAQSGDWVVQAAGSIWHLGTLVVAGTDSADTAGSAGELFLAADHDVWIAGTIDATGGGGGNGSTPAGDVMVIAFDGDITVDGTIDASGATNVVASTGGSVRFLTGPEASELDVGPAEEVIEPRPAGPGSYVQSGAIRADGGTADSDNSGDDGGDISIWVRGGALALGGEISVNGGEANPGNGSGGAGGGIYLTATPFVAPGVVVLPGAVTVDANLLAAGGRPYGGGGTVEIQVFAEREIGVDPDPMPLGGLAGTVSLTLLGLGEGIVADGGDEASDGGQGGWVQIINSVCPEGFSEGSSTCTTPDSGARWIWSDVDVHAAGGAGSSRGGGGGAIDVTMSGVGNALHAASDVARFESHGALDVAGGDGPDSNGNGGDIELIALAGDVVANGDLVASSGRGAGGDGQGGQIRMTAFAMTQAGEADLRGAGQGRGGAIWMTGWSVTSSAAILADSDDVASDDAGGGGGEVNVAASGPVVLGAPISLAGAPAAPNNYVGSGGQLNVIGGTIDLHGDVDASAPTVASCFSAVGGYVWLEAAVSVSVDADLDLDGASSDVSYGDYGGTITIRAPTTTTAGTWTLRGGDSASPDSAAGRGGDVIITGDNGADITATGGEANGGGSSTGGRGGAIDIAGDNTGCLDISPGNPGGAPGTLVIGGSDLSVCP